ncbi:MAG: hypothetical protein ABSF69_05545 [Polyangiaceae bacterium]|jgi:hypothetical protein
MALHRTTYRPAAIATAALFGVAAMTTPLREARAESPNVSPDGKGVVGGGLLGAEVVTITEALAGARPGWAYALGGGLGAAGGATGGYFIEKASTNGTVPMYMLAGGLALVIPAIVLMLNATRYFPEEGAVEDQPPTGATPEPGAPGGSVVIPTPGTTPASVTPPASSPPASTQPAPPPQSLLDVHGGALRVGVPVPDVRPVYSVAEQREYGIRSAQTELRMPVLHVAF